MILQVAVVGRAAVATELTGSQRQELESLARARKTGQARKTRQAMARRARIVLAAAAGLQSKATCIEVGADANAVGKWRTHDDARHGTASLLAALDVASGAAIGRRCPRHRSSEFRKLLDRVEASIPADLDVHVVMDNCATRRTKPIRGWLAKRPRWHARLTPASASWINQAGRFFALVADRQIRRGVHRSTQRLETDIRAFIDARNAHPEPSRRTKSADDIPAAIQRFRTRTKETSRTSESGQ